MKSRTWRRRLRPVLVLVAALAVTLVPAIPAHAVELPGSCNGWDTVGAKNIGGYVYNVQARSCVEKSSTTGAIRAHTGVRFLRSGSATSAFPYAQFAGVELWRTPSAPVKSAASAPSVGDWGGASPGPTISGYSVWKCGEPHEFWTHAAFNYQYPDGTSVGKTHASYGVNVNPDC